MIGGDTGRPRLKSTGPGTPMPAPIGRSTPTSAMTSRTTSSAVARTTSGPWRMSQGRVRVASTASRPSVTPTDMPVAPIEMPTKRMSAARSTSVERRPPREAAGPASWASPSSVSRATSAATVVRETWSRSASWAFESGPSSRSWASNRACKGLSARPARE